MSSEVPWSVKEQTVVDKSTGVAVRFGSYGSHSSQVFLQIHVPGDEAKGSTIIFQRGGEPTRIIPHVVEQTPMVAVPNGPPEPYRDNPYARHIGSTPGVAGAAPGTKVEDGEPGFWDQTVHAPLVNVREPDVNLGTDADKGFTMPEPPAEPLPAPPEQEEFLPPLK